MTRRDAPAVVYLAFCVVVAGGGWFTVRQRQIDLTAQEERSQEARDAAVQHAMEVQLRAFERSERSAAIQLDVDGKVTWRNAKAREWFPTLQEGSSIESIMSDEDAEKHKPIYAAAMESHRTGGAMTDLECTARTFRGFERVHIETWSTPRGGMGFIDIVEPSGANQ